MLGVAALKETRKMDYDLKIVGGTIVDGTGQARYRGDVGVRGGKVVALGSAPGIAARTIDAGGQVVAPGFVDIHTHYDAQVLWDRKLSISPWHGVTTAVMGNCGFGVAPVRPADRATMLRTLEKVEGMSYEALEAGLGLEWPFESFAEYLSCVEGRGSVINLAAFVGHTPVRLYVMGDDAMEREATGDEIEAMAAIVRDAVQAGAIGFATAHAATQNAYDGRPVPSRLASFSEIDSLVGAMVSAGGSIVQGAIGKTFFHDEMTELARRHDVLITWTALLSGMSGPGSHQRHLDRTEEQLAEGLRIVPQVACRPVMFDFDFGEPFPFGMLPLFRDALKASTEEKKAAYRDPEFRRRFKEETGAGAKNILADWVNRTPISVLPSDRAVEERILSEVASERGVDPVDLALDLSIESDFAARFRLPFLNYDQSEVAELLASDNTVLALSDAGAHASQLCDACYSTHFLGHWRRDEGVVDLETAVHMLTQKPADVMGLRERGRLALGLPADLVIFDPDSVNASGLRRVHDLPAGQDRLISEAEGIRAVVVNGTVIREEGEDTLTLDGGLPGAVLRGGH
jgi:N-acyl-D-aspartate/D-glutamate deacylase